MQKEEIKFRDSTIFEGMTSIRALIRAMDEKISDRRILTVLYDRTKEDKNRKEIGYLKAVSEKYGFSVRSAETDEIDAITLGNSSGGIVCFAGERTIPPLPQDARLPRDGFYALIEGIEDPYNFGYALRSLYACGLDGILLPPRSWYSAAGVVCRSSAGASELIPAFTVSPCEAAVFFAAQGYTVVCADERTEALLGDTVLKKPLLLIVGGERRGVSRALLDLCHLRVRIPYARPFSASLSAASAVTMFAYEIMRQNLPTVR